MDSQPRHSELTFHLMVEAAPNALLLVNKDGKIAYANLFAEKLFGYSKADLIGQGVEILMPERLRLRHPGYIKAFFTSPEARAMGMGRDLFAVRKDGTEFPVEIGLNPLITSEGTMVLAAIIDISERKKAEDRFRLVVDSAPNAMVLVNPQGKITLINRQTEQLFGYTREELIGQALEILIPERFRKTHPNYRNQFYEKPKTRSMGAGRELFALTKDGKEVPVEIGLNPIETPEGNMVLASIIDISERKMRDAAIQKHIELESKNKELEQFAYITSHDLREPLRTLSNYIVILKEDYLAQCEEKAMTYALSMERALHRMEQLIEALLDYSRLGQKAKPERVDLNNLLQDVLDDLSTIIADNKASIQHDPLPVLDVYETELRQLFQNLLSNAIKFRKKSVPPEIRITAKEENGKWLFSVSDNGIGIEPQHFQRVFLIFQRLHTHEEYEGSGIGLANCKKIIELHKGEMWVESTPDAGSTFFFTLPTYTFEHEASAELHSAGGR